MDNPVSTPLTFSRGAELQFFPVQQMLSGCRKIQNQDRTAGFQVGSFCLGCLISCRTPFFLTPPTAVHVRLPLAQFGAFDGHPVLVIFLLQSSQESSLVQV